VKAPRNAWTELASRSRDGLEVSLWWSEATGRVEVRVVDQLHEESFRIRVDGPDALDAFHHPFAYATGRGCRFDLVVPSTSLDLHPQS
jgi:hypothetical protein